MYICSLKLLKCKYILYYYIWIVVNQCFWSRCRYCHLCVLRETSKSLALYLNSNCEMDIFITFWITACGPGKYRRGKYNPSVYCIYRYSGGASECVKCPGQTVKMGYGNSETLCVNSCDGTTNVPNDGHFACGLLSIYLINCDIVKNHHTNEENFKNLLNVMGNNVTLV